MFFQSIFLFILKSSLYLASDLSPELESQIRNFFLPSDHTKNFAVLLSTSRNGDPSLNNTLNNYRHTVDVLSIYRHVKRLGIPDSNIILMIPEVMACTSQNPLKGIVIGEAYNYTNIYTEDVEVDYRGYDVDEYSFFRLLAGLVPRTYPKKMHLLSDDQSNILIYMGGHGGEGFLKFQDRTRITYTSLGDAIEFMYQKKRYKELFIIADTCQSSSIFSEIYSPNVIGTSSSLTGEESFAHHYKDYSIGPHGIYVLDRYIYYVQKLLTEKVHDHESNVSISDYLASCNREECLSTVGIFTDLYPKSPAQVRVTDFFGARRFVLPLKNSFELGEEWARIPTGSEERDKKWQF